MAPRTAKAKKNADIKVSENEPVKKGRGKGKTVTDPEQDSTEIVAEKATVPEKKSKRGKNVVNYNEDANDIEEKAPPAKKGRKKNIEESASDSNTVNGDHSAEVESPTPTDDHMEENESNGNSEEIEVPTAKGRKKPAKKEVKPKDSGQSKKNAKQDTEDSNKEEVEEEKPKGRGRNKKPQTKPDPEIQEDKEEVKKEPAKGRKKGQNKSEEKPKPEKNEEDIENDVNEEDNEVEPEVTEPKKKGRKNAKKPSPKEESEEKDDETDEISAAKRKRGGKKEDKAKGDAKEETEQDEEVAEMKPKSKRGQKKVVDEEVQDTGEPTNKRRRKDDKATEDNKKKPGKTPTDYESIDFSNTSKNDQGKEWNLKISSWNVDGIRAWMLKDGLEYIRKEKPDILCLQEVKCSQDKLPEEVKNIPGYHAYWLCSDKDGYAGVGIYTTKLAMNVQYGLQNEELDSEGRIITAEYEQFYLICTYVPNAGRKLVTMPKRLKWNEEFRKYVKSLDKNKPVIICGDMNVAHNEIDLANPKTNKKNAGFTQEERSGMSDLLGDGFVDIFRHFYPDKTGAYTFWTYMFNSRAKNVGWRLDYFIVSERLIPALCDTAIRDKVYGSDHCPISLFLHITSAEKPKE